jgi:hypothetical protein
MTWRTFWDRYCVMAKIWERRTTVIGYVTACWGVLELNADAIGSWITAPRRGLVLVVIGLINAMIGHYNNSLIKRRGD